jgi:hypothetical protein
VNFSGFRLQTFAVAALVALFSAPSLFAQQAANSAQ